VRDPVADGVDQAGGLHAQGQGHGKRVQAAALADIDEVEPNGLVADAHLARTGIPHRDIDKAQPLWACVMVDLDGFDDGVYHGGGSRWRVMDWWR